MWYAVIGGVGLAVGLGLMIWALRERGLRAEAQAAAAKALVAMAKQRELAKANASKAQNLEFNCTKLNEVITAQRQKLKEARQRLAHCQDPGAVKSWLDDVLEGGEL